MEFIKYFLSLSVAGLTIGAIMIYLGKIIINKSSEIMVENHKNKLELLKIEHQLKLSTLYTERGNIIKRIFQSLFELEVKLETLTTIFQGPEWSTDTTKDEDASSQLNLIREILEVNRIYFTDKLCSKIENVLDECKEIILQMRKAKLYKQQNKDAAYYGENLPFNDKDDNPLIIWQNAERKVRNEIRALRMTLAENFRELMGVN